MSSTSSSTPIQMDRFSLFRLPTVAISEIMKMYDLLEITLLSMCSKRSCRWIKAFRVRRNALEMGVVSYKDKTVNLYNESEKQKLRFIITSPMSQEMHESVKIGDLVYQMKPKETQEDEYHENCTVYPISMYTENRIEGLKVLSEYLCSLFEVDINGVRILEYLNLNDQIEVMKWVTKRQKRFQNLSFDSSRMNDTTAEYVFSKINEIERVHISFEASRGFKTNFKFEGRGLSLHRSHWFTIDNLLNINSSKLHVNESKLTNKDMNSILKHWMSSDLKFKYMHISMMEEVRIDDLFDGIPFEERTNNVRRVYRDSLGPTTISGGYDIPGVCGTEFGIPKNSEISRFFGTKFRSEYSEAKISERNSDRNIPSQ
uniref:FBA_2 domain-containing protein n=1 Tax=Caenorhabditis tropicalis TaxID=1561998 RepID=A0A1I7THZ3_9PELO